ncbi:MAG: NADH-quinone oxidoreductase subunit NuoK [Myxococcales bacterium]
MVTPGLPHFLVVAALLFVFGCHCVLSRRNAVGVLMGVELILNGANLNLVAFDRFGGGALAGQVFALFVIVVAAAEAAVALAIVLTLYASVRSIDVTHAETLRE